MNMRLRRSGRKLLFVHDAEIKFIVRDSLPALWKRQFLAGYWKPYINRKSRKHFLLRHLIPGVFSLFLTVLLLTSFCSVVIACIFGSVLALYIFGLAVECAGDKVKLKEYPVMFLIFFIIHYAYGLGILLGVGKK
ncbi:MAG: hypothetical protein U5N26_11875 [Candidatus Marinimicrobia bacterium]|nr:hypothetical protein [Candidatus Neomarinimicrobiota bacterium]